MAGAPAVQRACQNRHARWDAGDAQAVGGLFDQELVAAWFWGWLKNAVGFIRQALFGPEDPDKHVELVEVRLQIVIADRPVVAQSVDAAVPEIVRTEAQRDAPPMIGAAAEHARAEPVERGTRRHRVGFAIDVPPADAAVELDRKSTRLNSSH